MEAPTISQLRSGPPAVSLAVRRVGATYHVPVAELLRFLHASETIDQSVPSSRESSR
jgi:hypothetical protein